MSTPTRSTPWRQPGDAWGSGMVTGLSTTTTTPPPPVPPAPPEPAGPDGPQRRRRQMLIFGGIAGAILAIGLSIILIVVTTSDGNPFRDRAAAPTDVRPPLAQACPAPTVPPTAPPSNGPAAPPATGPRTLDRTAGISYRAYGEPWLTWDEVWRAGTLEVPYRVGQHFVTETYPGGEYHASILSAAVPAADNDALTFNLECVGRQVAADVRAEYYPQPNTMHPLRDELTTLGGRPAWVSKFRLHFDEPGLAAKEELSSVAVIDVGRPTAAVLYVSVPGTVKQWEYVVDEVLTSVRPL